jgi:hypothetical protein
MTEKRERWDLYGETGIIGETAVSSHLSYTLQLFEVIDTDGHTWAYQIGTDDPVTGYANKYDAWQGAVAALAALIGA